MGAACESMGLSTRTLVILRVVGGGQGVHLTGIRKEVGAAIPAGVTAGLISSMEVCLLSAVPHKFRWGGV